MAFSELPCLYGMSVHTLNWHTYHTSGVFTGHNTCILLEGRHSLKVFPSLYSRPFLCTCTFIVCAVSVAPTELWNCKYIGSWWSALTAALTDISMVFEVLGNNLLKLIIASDYKGLPVHTVKWITKQVHLYVHYVQRIWHACAIV